MTEMTANDIPTPDEIAPLDPVLQQDDASLAAKVNEALESSGDELSSRLVRAFQSWIAMREHAKKEAKRLSEELSARIAMFAQAMNVGHSKESEQILKLTVVEQRWQDLEDARDARKVTVAALREQIKAGEQKIKDLIAEARSGQMSLFQTNDDTSSADAPLTTTE